MSAIVAVGYCMNMLRGAGGDVYCWRHDGHPPPHSVVGDGEDDIAGGSPRWVDAEGIPASDLPAQVAEMDRSIRATGVPMTLGRVVVQI